MFDVHDSTSHKFRSDTYNHSSFKVYRACLEDRTMTSIPVPSKAIYWTVAHTVYPDALLFFRLT
jgi:hypothetical protein